MWVQVLRKFSMRDEGLKGPLLAKKVRSAPGRRYPEGVAVGSAKKVDGIKKGEANFASQGYVQGVDA